MALTSATYGHLRVQPTIRHSLKQEWSGFGRESGFLPTLEHRFVVVIERAELDQELGLEMTERRSREHFAATLAEYRVPEGPRALSPDHLAIAHLVVNEVTPMTCETHWDGDWAQVMDSLTEEDENPPLSGALLLLTAGADERPGLDRPLASGSFFWLTTLGVHPMCRGQGIARALLVHALLAVRRAPGDLAVVEAYPGATLFDHTDPKVTVRDVERLVRLYESAGFLRLEPHRSIRNEPQVLYQQLSMGGLPAAPTDDEVDQLDEMRRA